MTAPLTAAFVLVATAALAQERPLGEQLRTPPLYSLQPAKPTADPAPVEPQPTHRHDDTAMWAHIAALSADWSVTAVCSKVQCAPDQYGYVRGVDPSQQKKASVLGLILDGTIIYLTREWVQPDHPKLAAVIFYGLGGFRLVTTTHKASEVRRNTSRSAPPGT